jgi:hypothetical protein
MALAAAERAHQGDELTTRDHQEGSPITIDLAVYSNGDHVGLAWLPRERNGTGHAIADLRGFAINRAKNGEATAFLHNTVGFDAKATFPADAPWKWPIQRYIWWDYDVQPGDTVGYQIVPVTGPADALTLRDDLASEWSAC